MLRNTSHILFRYSGGASSAGLFSATPLLLNRQAKKFSSSGSDNPNKMNPYSSEGNVGNSFEKIVDDIGNNMPFKMTQDMYDRPPLTRNHDTTPEAHMSPTSGQEAANAALQGKDHDSPRVPKDRFTFDKVYDPKVLKTSTVGADYYYAPPPTKKEVERRRKARQMWVVTGFVLICAMAIMDYFLPPLMRAQVMAGRT